MKGLAIFGAVLLAASVFAAELILQPDPAKGKDSMVSVNSPTRNYGTYPYLMVNYGPGKTVRGIVEFTG
ncbi:MAG: hypothetical protein GTN49_02285, partial [candidate division Zixibacteria bacterium]|nr:hypothetical protein [candidate division Zixibacteria bacterium]